jgi:hypothetical protein
MTHQPPTSYCVGGGALALAMGFGLLLLWLSKKPGYNPPILLNFGIYFDDTAIFAHSGFALF